MTSANLALAFLLELAALAALAVWGAHAGGVALAVAAPVAMAVGWGLFLAPKATVALPSGMQLALIWAVFALAAVALRSTGRTTLAVALAGTFALNQLALAF